MPDNADNASNFYIADAAILVLYVIWSYVFERVAAVRWLHQTGLAMVVGMVFGAFLQATEHITSPLSTEMILYVLLPCIMLDAGYNLHVHDMYHYGAYIFSLGVLGSISMFVMLYACFQHLSFIGLKGEYQAQDRHKLIMAMVLTASDTVAPLALIPRDKHAQLHAIVFGEAIMNDVVVLFLSSSMLRLGNPNLFGLAAASCWDILLSSVLGIFSGIAVGFVLGSFRSVIREGPVERPAALILLSCYIAYGVAEKMKLSGVMVMLITAVVLKMAVREVLEKEVDEFLTGVTKTAGFLAESFMYGYFGMTFVQVITVSTLEPPAISFIATCAGMIIICRLPVIIIVRGIGELLSLASCVPDSTKKNARLPLGDTVLVGFCGTIRGVLAVVLVIRVMPKPSQRDETDNFCVQAVLTLVVIHVLVAGPLLSIAKRVLKIKTSSSSDEVRDFPSSPIRGSVLRWTFGMGARRQSDAQSWISEDHGKPDEFELPPPADPEIELASFPRVAVTAMRCATEKNPTKEHSPDTCEALL